MTSVKRDNIELEPDPLSLKRLITITLLAVALVILPSQLTDKRINVDLPFGTVETKRLDFKLGIPQLDKIVPETAPEPTQAPVVAEVVETPPPVVPEPVAPVVKPKAVDPASEPVGSIHQMIIDSATKYGVSSDRLLRIADCESSFNPRSVNRGYYAGGGHPTGLFQYLPETWTRYQRKMGVSGWDIYNPSHQAELTAFAFSIGGSSEWECR